MYSSRQGGQYNGDNSSGSSDTGIGKLACVTAPLESLFSSESQTGRYKHDGKRWVRERTSVDSLRVLEYLTVMMVLFN